MIRILLSNSSSTEVGYDNGLPTSSAFPFYVFPPVKPPALLILGVPASQIFVTVESWSLNAQVVLRQFSAISDFFLFKTAESFPSVCWYSNFLMKSYLMFTVPLIYFKFIIEIMSQFPSLWYSLGLPTGHFSSVFFGFKQVTTSKDGRAFFKQKTSTELCFRFTRAVALFLNLNTAYMKIRF